MKHEGYFSYMAHSVIFFIKEKTSGLRNSHDSAEVRRATLC